MSSPSRLLKRRSFLARLTAALGTLAIEPIASVAAADATTPTFSPNVVLDIARALSEHPFIPPMEVPEKLKKLDYDRYRQIRFDKKAAVWAGTRTPFSVEMFAPGLYYTYGIRVHTIENGVAKPVQIDKSTFVTPSPEITDLLAEFNKVAGFRLHYPLNTPKYQDEFVVFAGASYFRAVSKGQNYGLSARGLAIDVAEPTGEEYPIFRQFWIERPANKSDAIVVHALLDSLRVTGAYQFTIHPGSPTRMEIKATLFPRSKLSHIGLGSLTSMFLFGGMDHSDGPDYRNAVHDSNGLAMLSGAGEYIWRPLNNPKTLQISAFVDNNPRGFGLIQRARQQSDYEDLEANYHKRPSTWVSPVGDWGEGVVVLVEIPTSIETNDNIVAYWRPKKPLEPGSSFEFAYNLAWPDDSPLPEKFGRVTRTAAGIKLFTQFPQMAVDFSNMPTDLNLDELRFVASVSNGRVLETQAVHNGPNGIRLFMTFDPERASMTEIRVQTRYQGKPLGETILYRWLAAGQ